MASSNAQLVLARIQAWNHAHPREQIDPRAALAVSSREGLSGGIGDGGHAFGPWQLNNAGGVITGKFAGQSAGQINKWAWTPAGIDYALSHIASVAGGLKGAQAVNAIVTRFERPANPSGEIAGALGALGLPASSASGYQTSGGKPGPGGQPVNVPKGANVSTLDPAILAALLSQNPFQPPPSPVIGSVTDPAVHFEAQPSSAPTDALTLARQYLDSAKGAFTNPGFAQYLHPSLPPTTVGQAASGSHTSSPKAGDLVFFGKGAPTHQGVSLGSSHFLHGTDNGTVLRVSSLAAHPYQGGLVAARTIT